MVNIIKNKNLTHAARLLTENAEEHDEKITLSLVPYHGAASLNDFYTSLLNGLNADEKKEIIPAFLARNIIAQNAKIIFQKDNVLKNLIKSSSFFKELYGIFSNLSDNFITSDDLKNIAQTLPEIDKNRLFTVAEVFEKYLKTLEENNFLDLHTAPLYLSEKVENKSNIPVFFLTKKLQPSLKAFFESAFEAVNIYTYETEEADAVSKVSGLYVFDDISSEISSVADMIKERVDSGQARYADFAVLIRDNEDRKKFVDLFKTYGLAINCENYTDDFRNFKMSLIRHLKICAVYEKLGIEGFSKEEFEKLKYLSKADSEMLFDELNSYISTILTEVLEDGYARDRFLSLREQNKNVSLLNAVYSNLEILKDKDKNAVTAEFDKIKVIYPLYRSKRFLELISYAANSYKSNSTDTEQNINTEKDENFKSGLNKILGAVKALMNLYMKILETELPLDIILETIESAQEDGIKTANAVNIETYGVNKSYKHVFIPSMCEGRLPKKNMAVNFISPDSNKSVTLALQAIHPDFDAFILTDEQHALNEEKLLFEAMSCARETLILSTHLYEEKKETQVSFYFQKFADLSGILPVKKDKVETEKEDFMSLNDAGEGFEKENVISQEEVLKLNASAITSYLRCPKKYYFKGLLNLKEQSTFAANYGNIVHAIFEVFNSKYLDKYNKETILVLKDILFDSINNPETALEAGFKELDIDLVKAAEKLALEQMKINFENAVKELDKNGYFQHVPKSAQTEKPFKFELADLPHTVFDGRIDAVLELEEGFEIVDYKTGKNKENDLEYALSDFGVNFMTKTGRLPSNIEDYQRNYDYQIPLYYLAAQNAKELENIKDKVHSLGLQYVRPSNKGGGSDMSCFRDFANAVEIETQKEKILNNLKTTVIDKIRDTKEFERFESFNCSDCAYEFLCDESETDDE